MRMCHFWTQSGPFVLNENCLKNHYSFNAALVPFHSVKFKKKSFERIQNHEDSSFLDAIRPIRSKQGFFGKFCLSYFPLLIVPYHVGKFERSP